MQQSIRCITGQSDACIEIPKAFRRLLLGKLLLEHLVVLELLQTSLRELDLHLGLGDVAVLVLVVELEGQLGLK